MTQGCAGKKISGFFSQKFYTVLLAVMVFVFGMVDSNTVMADSPYTPDKLVGTYKFISVEGFFKDKGVFTEDMILLDGGNGTLIITSSKGTKSPPFKVDPNTGKGAIKEALVAKFSNSGKVASKADVPVTFKDLGGGIYSFSMLGVTYKKKSAGITGPASPVETKKEEKQKADTDKLDTDNKSDKQQIADKDKSDRRANSKQIADRNKPGADDDEEDDLPVSDAAKAAAALGTALGGGLLGAAGAIGSTLGGTGGSAAGSAAGSAGGYGSGEGGYGPDEGGYGPDEGGYGPNEGGYGSDECGYGPNEGGYGPDEGGYGPDEGGYGPNEGGYGSDEGNDYGRAGEDNDESAEEQDEPVEDDGESAEEQDEPVEDDGESAEEQDETIEDDGESDEEQDEPVEDDGESDEEQDETGENNDESDEEQDETDDDDGEPDEDQDDSGEDQDETNEDDDEHDEEQDETGENNDESDEEREDNDESDKDYDEPDNDRNNANDDYDSADDDYGNGRDNVGSNYDNPWDDHDNDGDNYGHTEDDRDNVGDNPDNYSDADNTGDEQGGGGSRGVEVEPETRVYKDPATDAETLYKKDPETGEWVNPVTNGVLNMDDLDRSKQQRMADKEWMDNESDKLRNRTDTHSRELDEWSRQQKEQDARNQKIREAYKRQFGHEDFGAEAEARLTESLLDDRDYNRKREEYFQEKAEFLDKAVATSEVAEGLADGTVGFIADTVDNPATKGVRAGYKITKGVVKEVAEKGISVKNATAGLIRGTGDATGDFLPSIEGKGWNTAKKIGDKYSLHYISNRVADYVSAGGDRSKMEKGSLGQSVDSGWNTSKEMVKDGLNGLAKGTKYETAAKFFNNYFM